MNLLYNNLKYINASRQARLQAAELVLANKPLFPGLLKICFMVEDKVSVKACWVLEFVCKKNMEWLLGDIDYFIENIHKIKFDSAVRPIAKICEMLCCEYFGKNDSPVKKILNTSHLQKITECCFDWIINDEKVAVKAYSMQTLYLLGKEIKWIHPELKKILEIGFSSHSAAYKARARHILYQLNKN
ncbi:adenylosuccinate lyase [Abyssalbus ytuae]|uniref:Adenylosuccinate lyase n=1 Tax=Abyssalbus ytuae TaxID=2926907 RepID=A0A9E6ZQX9_9FLAO|nr:adenylosuccinate lyase [Abyssalbus ytuae]UOB17163.1 adenylosuccinate lyase [Abyssalbus ytuae]